MSEKTETKPILIVPEGEVAPQYIDQLTQNGIVCIEAANPDEVRFLVPPSTGLDKMESAAVGLFRYILGRDFGAQLTRNVLLDKYAELLTRGTELEKVRNVEQIDND